MKYKQGWKSQYHFNDFSREVALFDRDGRLIEKKENPVKSFFLISALVLGALVLLPWLLGAF